MRCVAIFVPLASLAAAACGIDTSLKHRCERDQDCAAGRVCYVNRCLAPTDAAPSVDAPDASADRTEGGGDVSASPNYMFVTSERYRLDWVTLDVPDLHCNQAAAEAGLPGSYRAWLSTSRIDARDRLGGARGWIRPDGAPFADTVDDIVHGRIFNPPSVDEHRQGTLDIVATGTTEDGVLQVDGNCRDWSAPSYGGQAETGFSDSTMTAWTQAGAHAFCDNATRIYCFGVDRVAVVAPVPVEGKVVFLSWRQFTSGAGIASADSLCNLEAAEAGLTGTFLAFLAQDAVPAIARLPAGQLWVRPDGVPLNAPGWDLFTAGPFAPLNVTARGAYARRSVFTGGEGPAGFIGTVNNCNDWHGTDPAVVALGGLSTSVSQWMGEIFASCAYASSIYCFQQ